MVYNHSAIAPKGAPKEETVERVIRTLTVPVAGPIFERAALSPADVFAREHRLAHIDPLIQGQTLKVDPHGGP